jgi:hypothetical protein
MDWSLSPPIDIEITVLYGLKGCWDPVDGLDHIGILTHTLKSSRLKRRVFGQKLYEEKKEVAEKTTTL